MGVFIKGSGSNLETYIVDHMLDCQTNYIKFKNLFFRCNTIEDGEGSRFVKRENGEWIDYTEDGYVECPFCHSATNCDGNKDELHFCFSCGADLRGE